MTKKMRFVCFEKEEGSDCTVALRKNVVYSVNFIRLIFHSATHQSEKNSFNKNTIRKLTKGKQLFNCIIKQLDHSVGSTELRTVKARQIVRTTNSANRCEHCSVEPAIRQIFKWKIFHLES